MENLIGEEALDVIGRLRPGIRPHLYGKREARPGRKMGHLNHVTHRG
jgi:5-(carboxyamino)imidazole ribonucleotide synthase